jgi:hypothetical protein
LSTAELQEEGVGATKDYWLPQLFCEWHWSGGNGETDTILGTNNDLTHVRLDCAGFDDMSSNALFCKSTLSTDKDQSILDAALKAIAILQELGEPVPNTRTDRWCLDCSKWTQNICQNGDER